MFNTSHLCQLVLQDIIYSFQSFLNPNNNLNPVFNLILNLKQIPILSIPNLRNQL